MAVGDGHETRPLVSPSDQPLPHLVGDADDRLKAAEMQRIQPFKCTVLPAASEKSVKGGDDRPSAPTGRPVADEVCVIDMGVHDAGSRTSQDFRELADLSPIPAM